MRRMPSFVAALAVAVIGLTAAEGGERGTRVMSGWFNVTTPEGWVGRRYMDGDAIFAEEFDANGDGRIDVWRFYRRGLLSSEERDLDGDGRVDYQSHWEARNVQLLSVFRDTNRRGVNDLEIESTGNRAWEIREDRNHDGIADRILLVNGPPDLFDVLGMDLSTQRNVIDAIPSEYWNELWIDAGFTGSITDYYRYTRGTLSHRGTWNSRGKFAWARAEPGYVPPSPPPLADPGRLAAAPPQAGPAPILTETHVPPAPPSTEYIRDPFDMSAGGSDPYADLGGQQAGAWDPYAQRDPYAQTDPYAQQDPYAYQDPYAAVPAQPAAQPPYQPQGPWMRDRTRYEGLPPGDSAARSVPARMRPPGSSRR